MNALSSFTFEAIGTHWAIDIYDTVSEEKKMIIGKTIRDRIEKFDRTYSRFKPDSWAMRVSDRPGNYKLPDDAEPMLAMYHKLYVITDGLMTPLIGQVLSDAGYDAHYSLHQIKPLVQPPAWDEALEFHPPVLTVKKKIMLDFGACGKGYLIDLVGRVLESQGIQRFCIDAGGDILHKGTSKDFVRIALEDPQNPDQAIGVITLKNEGIAGSSGNRRTWGSFHHTINPKTLASPREALAIWVVAETELLADALSTALSFCAPEKLAEYFSFSYLILRPDRSVEGTLAGNPSFELFA